MRTLICLAALTLLSLVPAKAEAKHHGNGRLRAVVGRLVRPLQYVAERRAERVERREARRGNRGH